ncbi:siroheme synthase [Sphingobium sp. SYK-6]|uniref:precorrin-2 dehydrogenase/sirohydrochlorin ferrochelatase family protein n=1 Tax=Sphingobium sp. (strain NBRC 103272 / SYK-6) TaxID=627192 RepID=UPI0002276BB9|nr:bifunctional precorrin-2 dehydrogenase/sirohydrochlorin ferrochelatase [Sphingobium sp. SYK-6]BAK64862.1 siroheme synthase [Sphingobium sp. SYK-6]
MHSLPLFFRIAGRPVILLGTGEAAQAKRRLIERAGGIPVGEADEAASLAFIALDDPEESAQAAGRLRARGILVNVVDQPALCDFTTPAIVDRDPVLVAIGTGGASAGLAKAVRQRIERLLPPGLGALAQALAEARAALRARWPDARQRRQALDDALREKGMLDPLGERPADAVRLWLEGSGEDGPADRAETILLTSSDPDDLSLRAARLLGEADRILHDPTVPETILARARADASRVRLTSGSPRPAGPGLTLIVTWAKGA